ncbi:hypothetical protein VPH35_025585 [Triticum aestivum]
MGSGDVVTFQLAGASAFAYLHRVASSCLTDSTTVQALNSILWLLYQLADDVAIYVLGHMSLSSKPRQQQQLMAFWASLLLVHLGGQDTITAYAIEDNNLWLRHLFTLVVQAAGAAYVLYKYVAAGSWTLLAAAVLMSFVGVIKYGERIYALRSSGLDNISNFLDNFEVPRGEASYPVLLTNLDEEEVLQGAHDLLPICMGQLVDNNVRPSGFRYGAINAYHNPANADRTAGRSMLPQLIGMQLSLMRDLLYTKAAVIHRTSYGCISRIFSTVCTIVAFYLFRQSTMAGAGYSKGDMAVTYILLAGAFFLELASLSRAFLSTWTCTWLKAAGWNRLHAALVWLRRGVKAAQRCRRWSGSIGQHDLLEYHMHGKSGLVYTIASFVGLEHRWNRLRFFHPLVISLDLHDLLVREIERMVEASGTTYDSRNLDQWRRSRAAVGAWVTGGAGAQFYTGATGAEGEDGFDAEEAGFDGTILAWCYATHAFLDFFDLCCTLPLAERLHARAPIYMDRQVQAMSSQDKERQQGLAKAIRVLSRYMVFLLVEQPHLLPSPVRRSKYDSFCMAYREFPRISDLLGAADMSQDYGVLRPAVHLANRLLARCEHMGAQDVLLVMSQVWVEMLCYAASHCNHEAHARQLSSGTEFITVVLILSTTLKNGFRSQ